MGGNEVFDQEAVMGRSTRRPWLDRQHPAVQALVCAFAGGAVPVVLGAVRTAAGWADVPWVATASGASWAGFSAAVVVGAAWVSPRITRSFGAGSDPR